MSLPPGRRLPLALALAALALCGLARREWGGGAESRRALEEAAAGLSAALPEDLDGWSGEDAEFDRRGLDRAGIAGIAARRYEHAASGARVTAVALCGAPGPIAAHGPESCYPGVGYEPTSPARRVGGLWSADFVGDRDGAPRELHVLWAWSDGRGWSAPERPRLAFASARLLYKIYLIHESTSAAPAAHALAAALTARFGANGRAEGEGAEAEKHRPPPLDLFSQRPAAGSLQGPEKP